MRVWDVIKRRLQYCPELPVGSDVAVPWDIAYFIESHFAPTISASGTTSTFFDSG